MIFYHLYGDESGETHLAPIELPVGETDYGTVRGLSGIPADTVGMGQFLGGKPDSGMHQAPRRQLLVVLNGELQIITSTGQEVRLHPGDVMLADDCGTKGHISREVGEQPLMLMAIGIHSGWELPAV